jgi:TetR/AcrR family fatty acid metabolism transcriptional regulator
MARLQNQSGFWPAQFVLVMSLLTKRDTVQRDTSMIGYAKWNVKVPKGRVVQKVNVLGHYLWNIDTTSQKSLDRAIHLNYTRKSEVSLIGGVKVKEDKKELIRETAIEVIANLGFHNATTDRIAAEAGISVGTIYNYFRSKEAILEYIFEVELDKRRTYLKNMQQESLSLRDKLERLLIMHFAAIDENPAVGKILAREHPTPLHNNLSTTINDFLVGIPAQISKLLDEGVQNGEIRPCNTQITAVAIFGAVSSVVLYAVGQDSEQERAHVLQQAASELVNVYFQGLSI